MGVGMSLIVGADDVDAVRDALGAEGLSSFVMGECVEGDGKGKVMYR